ncbi:malonyl-CoA-acyl carrier protein transacylase, mitochondrial-like isoform X2 [Oppia nitens]|uniref:malonyl-CoA-acyl carrier protein transacylase, mitochondrial-like isoform X2 n=2 Tax=Oppia nitens TaxID=1686743 RepID=UPI0023DBAD67|nr:malonyl-CoA-acyl carrier protein transacylase, mitochondrial-like isoform X2 [Oppia nitens]
MVRRDQSRLALRPKTAPEDTTVILFPGQGSQFVGMGYNVIESSNVKQMFSIAKQILGYDLLDLCLNGPIETLNKTQYCQPAIYVTSLAAVECLRQRGTGDVEACVATAGFSVGELSALVFAGAMSFEDGLRLVKIRAESMQYASELVPSAMITVFFNADARISFACNAAREWCVRKGIEEKDAICNIANYLFPHCKVIAGHEEAINFLEMNAKDFGIKRSKRLPVSGAFHTKLMEPARKVMAEALRKIHLEVPLIPVHSNFDAKIYKDVVSMRKKLAKQIVSPVHWEQILHIVYDRPKDMKCPKTFECGPGKSLLSTLSMVHAVARRSAHHISV